MKARSIADVARSIGVIEGMLGSWVAKARREREQGSSLTTDERSELAWLRGERTAADGA
jgi:transposase